MYKEFIKIEKVTYYKVVNKKLVVLEKEDGNYRLYDYPDFTDEKIVEGNFGGDIINIDNLILGSNFKGFNIKDLSIQKPLIEQSYVIHNHKNIITKKVFYKERRVDYFLYDINFELLRQIPTDYPVIMKDDLLITRERHIGVYDFKTNKQLWQVDLSEKIKRIDTFKGTEVEGIIKGVLVYKDNLIVYSDGGVASLKLEDGSLNWFTKTYAVTFCIVGNIGYGGSNAAIYKINLNTGEMSGFDWKDHGMPDIEYQGKIYIPFCGDIIHHEGLLWRSWYDAGHSFLVAINPYDGHYEWVHHVDTNEKIGPPEFHDNKIFLLDTGGTLHIYEKVENNV